MPIVDVSHDAAAPEHLLARLGEVLPEIVAEAAACPEEPWAGSPDVGDIEVRFRPRSPNDVGELDYLIQVFTSFYPSRQENLQERSDLIRDRLQAEVDEGAIGVWLVLSNAAWSQT